MRFKICGSHLTRKVANECPNVCEQVEVVNSIYKGYIAQFWASALKMFPSKNLLHFFLKKPDLKNFLIFSQKSCSNFEETEISAQARKNKKVYPEKISYIFLYLTKWRPRKKILIFQETETLKKLLVFLKMELFSPPRENFFQFRELKPRKNFLYFLKRKLFLYFGKWKP